MFNRYASCGLSVILRTSSAQRASSSVDYCSAGWRLQISFFFIEVVFRFSVLLCFYVSLTHSLTAHCLRLGPGCCCAFLVIVCVFLLSVPKMCNKRGLINLSYSGDLCLSAAVCMDPHFHHSFFGWYHGGRGSRRQQPQSYALRHRKAIRGPYPYSQWSVVVIVVASEVVKSVLPCEPTLLLPQAIFRGINTGNSEGSNPWEKIYKMERKT